MSDKRTFVLSTPLARRTCAEFAMTAPDGWHVTFRPKTRSLLQNDRMWAMLADISRQVDWYGKKLSEESWKCVFSASLKKQEVVRGLHNDFVVLGQSTSQMSIREMSDLMEVMSAFGAERDVLWSEPVRAYA